MKLVPTDGEIGDEFGASVASCSGRVASGAPQDDDLGSNSGAVYVHQLTSTGWAQETKLTAFDGLANDRLHRERGDTRDSMKAEEDRLRRRRAELSVAIDRATLAESGLPTAPEERYFLGVDE